MTAETKAKISATKKGCPTWNKGIPMTDGQKAKISVSRMGCPVSAETRVRESVAKMGHTTSPETREKIGIALKGRIISTEWRANMAVSHMGHTASPETLAKMSIARWKGGRAVSGHKVKAKRRGLGFIPMNHSFSGCEAHHFNLQDVIHIPKKLHQSIRHNVFTGKNMERINALAFAWFTEDWT